MCPHIKKRIYVRSVLVFLVSYVILIGMNVKIKVYFLQFVHRIVEEKENRHGSIHITL